MRPTDNLLTHVGSLCKLISVHDGDIKCSKLFASLSLDCAWQAAQCPGHACRAHARPRSQAGPGPARLPRVVGRSPHAARALVARRPRHTTPAAAVSRRARCRAVRGGCKAVPARLFCSACPGRRGFRATARRAAWRGRPRRRPGSAGRSGRSWRSARRGGGLLEQLLGCGTCSMCQCLARGRAQGFFRAGAGRRRRRARHVLLEQRDEGRAALAVVRICARRTQALRSNSVLMHAPLPPPARTHGEYSCCA